MNMYRLNMCKHNQLTGFFVSVHGAYFRYCNDITCARFFSIQSDYMEIKKIYITIIIYITPMTCNCNVH